MISTNEPEKHPRARRVDVPAEKNASAQRTLSPIEVEVLWNRLLSVANEQQVALMRTAFSSNVRESQDLACGVFDTRGNMIAQSLTGTPGHINPMATGVRHFLRTYPPNTLKPGDVLITNDPWQTAGQLNDFTVLNPVFKNSRIVAYFANCCHASDVGGHLLSAEAHEVFEEGLRVPIMKLFEEGQPNAVALHALAIAVAQLLRVPVTRRELKRAAVGVREANRQSGVFAPNA